MGPLELVLENASSCSSKLGKCVFVFEMSLSSSGEGGIKIDPTVMPWVAQSMLNKRGWFVDGPVLLDYSATPCWTAP